MSSVADKPIERQPESAQPPADFTPLLGKATPRARAGFDPKTSKESGRSKNSVEYTNSDGSRSMVLSQTPVSVPDGRGGWAAADTRLVEDPKSKKAVPVRDGVHAQFAEYANDSALLRMDQSGVPVSIALPGARKAQRKVTDSTASYSEALPGTDLTYAVKPDGVKESLILKSAAAIHNGNWVFRMNLGALTPSLKDNAVLISDKSGIVATLPPIQVWDSSNTDSKKAARTGGSYGLKKDGDSWLLTVSVDRGWLSDKTRVFPVTVDPTYTYGFGGEVEYIAYWKGKYSCATSDDCGIQIGNNKDRGQNNLWRTALRYDFSRLTGKSITGARLDLRLIGRVDKWKPTSQASLYQATTPLGYDALGPKLASAPFGETGSLQSEAFTKFVADRVVAKDSKAWFMLAGTETDDFSYKGLQANLIVDYGTAATDGGGSEGGGGSTAPEAKLVAPIDGAVIATETPTLQVADAGEGTQYCFKVSTGFDGRSGSVVDSGCVAKPAWTVPKKVLHDGGRYSWTVDTTTGGKLTPAKWVGHFTLNQRVGEPTPAPSDHLGPVQVNLFNGNAHTEATGPEFQSVGGPSGVKFAYNSRAAGQPRGVRASYFNDSRHAGAADDVPVMVRTEAQVNLDYGNFWTNNSWKEYPLPPALNKDWFVIRWEGHFKAPVTGDFRFGGTHTDGAKIWINNKLVYDNPNRTDVGEEFLRASAKQDMDVSLTAGQRVPVKIELYHRSAESPRMILWAKSTEGADNNRRHNWAPRIVPTEFLYSQDTRPLPAGWTLSVPASNYVSAEMLDAAVILTDGAGGKHTWAKTSVGGYSPPPGEDGVLAFDGGGRITVTENDTVSIFNIDGTLASVASVLDAKKPAALQYIYNGSPPRLAKIKDPVSGRAHELFYNTNDSDDCYGGISKPQGADPAPAHMLCRIRYWDGTETRLWYIVDTLARIENPGADISDYDYVNKDEAKKNFDAAGNDPEKKDKARDLVGPLKAIRTGLAYDWLVRQKSFSGNTERTLIEYDTFYEADNPVEPRLRTVRVTAPAADGRESHQAKRPGHEYHYWTEFQDARGRAAEVDVVGVYPDGRHARHVTWDEAGRALTTTDITGATISAEWNAKDKATAATDSAGRRSTTVYDHADRPIDRYGPGPASCFDGQLPTPECVATMPHTHINYDEGLTGLSAAYYDNPWLSGVPKVLATGVGTSDGTLNGVWGTNPPVTNSGGWSGRFTGEIQFPATGSYALGLTATDGVRLWIDDFRVIDSWTDKPSTAVSGSYRNDVAGSRHRVRVEYYNRSGTTGALNFTWTPPGADAAVTVPGANLAPRYGLATSQTADDTSGGDVERAPSRHGANSYSDAGAGIDAVLGLAVSQTVDPDGLNLTARSTYERPGDGYLRKAASASPAGDIAKPDTRNTTTYYGDTETRSNPCVSRSPAVNQAGMAKLVTGPKPANGPAAVSERVYDLAGRVVAERIGDEAWTCSNYDDRGRATKKSYPASGEKPARTVNYDWAVDGDPLTTKMTDDSGAITVVTDLLGQVINYTDVNGVTSSSTYDVVGRLTSDTTTIKGVRSTVSYAWNNASQLTKVEVDGTTVATPAYTAASELANVLYGNGSRLDALARNNAGQLTALTWKTSESTVVDTVTRSRNNRVIDDAVTINNATVASYSYAYDTVGRLVSAIVPHHKLTYRFDGTDGCGPSKVAGLNSNRTAFTDSLDGKPESTTTFCYDGTDRLLSTSGGTTLSFTYDAHGDTVKVGDDILGYDATKRHISTKTAGGTSISYTRDPANRLTARTVTGAKEAPKNGTTRYSYSSKHDTADLVLDESGNLEQRIVPLPGGVLLTKNYDKPNNPTSNWSYPNIHGDVLFTADGSAIRTSPVYLYDPYGQNISPDNGVFSDIPISSTMAGGMDFGWLGQHERPVEHLGGQQAIEMGARTYMPILGRFLQVDPVAGGSANDYDYVNGDPINSFDLAGTSAWSKAVDVTTKAAEVVSYVPGPIGTVASGVEAAGHLAQGDKTAAAAAAVGMIPGGKLVGTVAKAAAKEAPAAAKAASKAASNSSKGAPPPNLSPPGAGRNGAFRQAKRDAGVPVTQQPDRVRANVDKQDRVQPGRNYDYTVPAPGGGTRQVTIRDDAGGHVFKDDPVQNRGPHFNGPANNSHYDY